MSKNTKTPPLQQEEVGTDTEEVMTDALVPYRFPSGTPLYICDSDQALKIAKAQIKESNLPVAYILAAEEKHTQEGNVVHSSYSPRLFKVVSSLIFEGVVAIHEGAMGLATLDDSALFTAPKIPWELVKKMENFFRYVDHELKGSESIVVLTFDTRLKDDSAGWGFVVPEQTTTAASCKYTPDSAIEAVPDDDVDYIQFVGTAHSHPRMKAFASVVDEMDQEFNDGLHITFGWGGETDIQFHIELIVGGVTFSLRPDQVFADIPHVKKEDVDPAWFSRVNKAQAQAHVGTNGTSGTVFNSGINWKNNLPKVLDVDNDVIIMRSNHENPNGCPVCFFQLNDTSKNARRCSRCQSFYLASGETVEDLLHWRKGHNLSVSDIDGTGSKKVILAWRESAWDMRTLKTQDLYPGKA